MRVAILLGLFCASATVALAQPPPEEIEYYATDALGSVRVVFTPTGQVLGRSDYLPFGETLNQSGALPRQRFTGQERDGEAGMDYFNARNLQLRTGRMNAPDPLFGGAVGNPQAWNRYSYVQNNPLIFTDPTGESIFSWFLGIFGHVNRQSFDVYVLNPTPVFRSGNESAIAAGGTYQSSVVGPPANTSAASFSIARSGGPVGGSGGEVGRAGSGRSGSSGSPSTGTGTGPGSSGDGSASNPASTDGTSADDAKNSNCSASRYANARYFVEANLAAATQVANTLDTTPGNLLGLSGFESGWGTGPLIQAGTNNYFSLQAGPAFATGSTGRYKLGANTFWTYSSYLGSAQAFAGSYFGARVRGTTDPVTFAQAMNSGGKFNSEQRSVPYNTTLVNSISIANGMLKCR